MPTEVTLRWDDGKQVEGRYGQQVMYTLTNDRIMFVPPVVAERISELGIRQGEPFEICKAEIRKDDRRWIEWQVRRIATPQQPASLGNGTAAAAECPSTKAQDPRNGSTNGSSNNKGALRYEPTEGGVLLPAPIDGRGVTAMELSMHAAVEIAQRVEGRAMLRNQSVRFSSEDIRAIGLTLFIQAAREGGARWQV
jgi:hypothetical protein